MDKDLLRFYKEYRITDYKGYRFVTYENIKAVSHRRYMIAVYKDSKKMGEVDTDNEKTALKSIKERIDKTEYKGGLVDFIKPETL
jgi:hypothetical protein